MRNILLIILGLLLYFYTQHKEKFLEFYASIFKMFASKTTSTIEKVEVVKEKVNNNLGMKVPDLKTVKESTEYLRTNKKTKDVSVKKSTISKEDLKIDTSSENINDREKYSRTVKDINTRVNKAKIKANQTYNPIGIKKKESRFTTPVKNTSLIKKNLNQRFVKQNDFRLTSTSIRKPF